MHESCLASSRPSVSKNYVYEELRVEAVPQVSPGIKVSVLRFNSVSAQQMFCVEPRHNGDIARSDILLTLCVKL